MKEYLDAIDYAVAHIPIYYRTRTKKAIQNLNNSVYNKNCIKAEEAIDDLTQMGIDTSKIIPIVDKLLE